MASTDERKPNVKEDDPPRVETKILPVSLKDLGSFSHTHAQSFLHPWALALSSSPSARNLLLAAHSLQTSTSPVAFPTETVYGLAADATNSEAVRGIYKAKQRPADNPLIVHVASLDQLRGLLATPAPPSTDPIPAIYHPLIERFWPGPLTIILPVPDSSPLAPEVTAGLRTFGARMPASLLALALIHTSGLPLAAPSANSSTRPSPTTAAHVAHDLDGRISLILDGGPCTVGVESTVVDALSDPPCVLRPGGVGIEQLRECGGAWKDVVRGYEDHEAGSNGGSNGGPPRAPGMKYRHYAPRARVVLVDPGLEDRLQGLVDEAVREGSVKIGILRTRSWKALASEETVPRATPRVGPANTASTNGTTKTANGHPVENQPPPPPPPPPSTTPADYELFDSWIGPTSADVARGLFSALRDLDLRDADVIFVEGIDDAGEEETAAAVMNRLRKAAGRRVRA